MTKFFLVSSQSPPIELDPVISSNEFFYNYDLGDVERTAQEAKAKFERTNFGKFLKLMK